MHYDNLPSGNRMTPLLVKLLVQVDVFNVWFAAGPPLRTYLKHKSTAVKATGMVALGLGIKVLELKWLSSG